MRRRKSWSVRKSRVERWGELEEIAALLRRAYPPVEPRAEYARSLRDRLMVAAEVRLRPARVVVEVRPPLWLALAVPALGVAYYLWRNRGARHALLAGLGL